MIERSFIWLSQIPRCATDTQGINLYDEVLEMDRLADGGVSDGQLTSDEFNKLRKDHRSLRRFAKFADFEAYIAESIDGSKCDPACIEELGILESRGCIASEKPDLPPLPKRPKAKKKKKPSPPPPPPIEYELEGPPSPFKNIPESDLASIVAPKARVGSAVDLSKIRITFNWSDFEKLYGGPKGLAALRSANCRLRRKEHWHGDLLAVVRERGGGFVGWNSQGMPVYSLYKNKFTFYENGALHFLTRKEEAEVRNVITKSERNKMIAMTIIKLPIVIKATVEEIGSLAVNGAMMGVAALITLPFSYGEGVYNDYKIIEDSQKMDIIRMAEPYMERIRNDRMGKKFRAPETYANLKDELIRIKRDNSRPLREKHRCMFDLWDMCNEMSSSDDPDWNNLMGQKARKMIEEFIRHHYPEDSKYAFRGEDLSEFNAYRKSIAIFEPYA